jgi:[ribosomal protein S5]-alanine N-acetyltransferase
MSKQAGDKKPMPLLAPAPIETERLCIRLVAESDLPSLLEVNSNEEVTALLPYDTWRSMEDAKAWYDRMAGIQAAGLALQFVIVRKATGHAVGTCLLFRFEEGSGRAELGYVLGRAQWGQGLMDEALRALLGCAFGIMGLRRIEAEVDTRNVQSARALRRLGFTKEGLLRQRWVAKGRAKDVEIYGLLQGDWPFEPSMDPVQPVQRQLDAYNAHDLERFVAVYADDVQVFRPPAAEPVLSGKAAFTAHYAKHRFTLPELHAEVVHRIVSGDTVVDHERVTGLGEDVVEAVAVYRVQAGLIRAVWFF